MDSKTAVTETPAELAEVIKRILDSDQQAKTITGEAKAQRAEAEKNIVKEKATLRAQYLAHAKEKIEQLRREEERFADEAIADAGEAFREQLAELEAKYQSGKDAWVEKIFELTIAE